MNTLNRSDTALVIIDPQDRLVPALADGQRMSSAIVMLIRVAALVGLPVLVTRQNPRGLGELVGGVEEALAMPGESVRTSTFDKMTFDCFADESFEQAVSAAGFRQLLVTGCETHICVCQTALSALDRGLSVHLAADACSSRDMRTHDQALTRLAQAGVVISNSESAAYELIGRAGTDEFRSLLAIVKGA